MASTCTEATLRQVLSDVQSLENSRDVVKARTDAFISDALDYDLDTLSTPSEMADDVLNNLTPSTIGCSEGDISPVEDYVGACIATQKAELSRKIKSLNDDVVDLVDGLLSVPEKTLCETLQDVYSVFETFNYSEVLDAIDTRITCITDADDIGRYTDDIQDINDRIDAVVDDLPMDDQGNWDYDKLTVDIDSDLASNLETFQTQSFATVAESRTTLDELRATASSINPESFY